MIGINIICIGRLKEKYLREACDEYAKRLKAFCGLEITELAEEKCGDNPSSAEIDRTLGAEGRRILQKAERSDLIISMCVEGEKLSSPQLSKYIDSAAVSGKSSIALVIGGSFGLSSEVKSRSDFKLSMSDMTFPHQLARVMLLEQVYRAFMISSGGKYHK